ncbi:hypothetical protein BDZ89DRAFT_1065531 [Hymenopellis radicata]|nr:hypothetical protein BDZ89DRAFT_1065531 [Hymenopellis radicata]
MSFLAQSFVPVYASQPDPAELGTHSMLIGGSTMYLNPASTWPTCATCNHPLVPLVQLNVSAVNTPQPFRAFIPGVVPAGGTFYLPEYDCYDNSTHYSTETRSWLLRIATAPLACQFNDTELAEARKKIEQGPGFLPAHLVETWVAGKEETLDQELDWGQDDSEEFYAAHQPEPGLKLLGHTTRGKYYCSDDSCPRAGTHEFPDRRELIQLGERRFTGESEEEDEAMDVLGTLGNSWIEQCIDHPDVLTLTMSGNW